MQQTRQQQLIQLPYPVQLPFHFDSTRIETSQMPKQCSLISSLSLRYAHTQPHRLLPLRRTDPPRPIPSNHILQRRIITARRNKINIRIRRALPPRALIFLNLVSSVPLIAHLSQHLYLSLPFSQLQCLLLSAHTCFGDADGWVLAKLDNVGVVEGNDAAGVSLDGYAWAGGGARHGHIVAGWRWGG